MAPNEKNEKRLSMSDEQILNYFPSTPVQGETKCSFVRCKAKDCRATATKLSSTLALCGGHIISLFKTGHLHKNEQGEGICTDQTLLKNDIKTPSSIDLLVAKSTATTPPRQSTNLSIASPPSFGDLSCLVHASPASPLACCHVSVASVQRHDFKMCSPNPKFCVSDEVLAENKTASLETDRQTETQVKEPTSLSDVEEYVDDMFHCNATRKFEIYREEHIARSAMQENETEVKEPM